MAGRGQRFKDAGYKLPKPMIDVAGVPMVERVRSNMPQADKLIVVALEEHRPWVREWLSQVDRQRPFNYPLGIHATYIPEVTAGTACTVYGVIEEVHPESELLVANSDQWMDWSPGHFIDYCRRSGADGVIPCFRAFGDKWSFLSLRDDGSVREVVEKRPISDVGTTGIYYWKRAADCFTSIEEMVKGNERNNQEFYLAPSYCKLIQEGAVVLPYPIPKMYSMGTPDDLRDSLATGIFSSQLAEPTMNQIVGAR